MNNNKKNKNIYVTQPFLPPLEEFIPYLKKIWENKWLTNNGPFHQQLEEELCKYLGVKYISLFSNGTLALMAALKVLDIKGEVITTPYTFVATTHSILWNNNKPVFVDIDPDTFNLDPNKIEEAITPNTTAIMPVHVYGNPCAVEEIDRIAKKHNLKVIYDACHAFGVKIGDNSVLNYGDLSVLSFHATKVFNTFEGGAVVCHDEETKKKLDNFKNFGIRSDITKETFVDSLGLNAKMSEIHAVMGLLQLKYIDKNIAKRKEIFSWYREGLKDVKGLKFLEDILGVEHNYSYFPILVDNKDPLQNRDNLIVKLEELGIFGKKYFYPTVDNFLFYKEHRLLNDNSFILNFKKTSQGILCLPVYPDLENNTVSEIIRIIKKSL